MAAPLQARTFVGPKSLGHCQLISTLNLALALNARQALTWPAPNSSPQHWQPRSPAQEIKDRWAKLVMNIKVLTRRAHSPKRTPPAYVGSNS